MSIRNVLKKYLDFKQLYFKFPLRSTNRPFNVLSVRCLRIEGIQIFRSTPFLNKIVFPIRNKIPSWKWLLAIPIVYASYDKQSE